MSRLFTPLQVGTLDLQHRVVMAPLTRMRADPKTCVPSDLAIEYYAQRASPGGLIVAEATFIAPEAGGLRGAPQIYTQDQIKQWKKITDAVHAKGGYIYLQLWAHGRVTNPKLVETVWGPTDTPFILNPDKPETAVKVTAMTAADINRFVGHYRQAALNSIEAGFDGVEIHGANGYLLDQFLQSVSNTRTDEYGGSLENRFRFPLAVLNAVCEAVGPGRVGIRMSPFGRVQNMREPSPLSTFVPWVKAIAEAQPKLAYVHALEPRANGSGDMPLSIYNEADDLTPLRKVLEGTRIAFIVAGAHNAKSALSVTTDNDDLVGFGRFYISNPDLPKRIENGWPFTPYDRPTFYTRGAKGYIDYTPYKGEQSRL